MSWVRSRGNWRDCNLSNVDSVLNPGDLLFCSTGHVAIYIGNGQMIHAPQTGDVVKVGPVQSGMIIVRYPG
jgi:cell wall-associated NlpC family hydrolase